MKPLTPPQLGTISSFSYRDGVGRINLDDGTELKVGTAGLKGIVSFSGEERSLVGVRVKVEEVAPHPLGGSRAMKLSRTRKEVSFKRVSTPAEWESKLCEAGLSAAHTAMVRTAIRPRVSCRSRKVPSHEPRRSSVADPMCRRTSYGQCPENSRWRLSDSFSWPIFHRG